MNALFSAMTLCDSEAIAWPKNGKAIAFSLQNCTFFSSLSSGHSMALKTIHVHRLSFVAEAS